MLGSDPGTPLNNPIYDAIDAGSNKKGARHFTIEDSTIRYSSTYPLFLMAHIFSKAGRFQKAKVSNLIVFAHDVTRSRCVTRVGFPIQMHQTFWGMTIPSFSPSFNVPRSITQNGMVSRLPNNLLGADFAIATSLSVPWILRRNFPFLIWDVTNGHTSEIMDVRYQPPTSRYLMEG